MGWRLEEGCEYVTFNATFYQPAEYCTEPAVPGSSYCAEHDPDLGEPDWDDVRKDQLYDCD